MKKTYQAKTQYVFDGTYYVLAESKEEAKRKIVQNCGMTVRNGYHSCLPYEEIDWEFDMFPNIKIGAITVQKK